MPRPSRLTASSELGSIAISLLRAPGLLAERQHAGEHLLGGVHHLHEAGAVPRLLEEQSLILIDRAPVFDLLDALNGSKIQVPVLLLLFAVLAVTFESLTMPVLVLLAVPLTLLGAAWALVSTSARCESAVSTSSTTPPMRTYQCCRCSLWASSTASTSCSADLPRSGFA